MCSEDLNRYENDRLLMLNAFEIVFIAIFNIEISYVGEYACKDDQNKTKMITDNHTRNNISKSIKLLQSAKHNNPCAPLYFQLFFASSSFSSLTSTRISTPSAFMNNEACQNDCNSWIARLNYKQFGLIILWNCQFPDHSKNRNLDLNLNSSECQTKMEYRGPELIVPRDLGQASSIT